MEPGKEKRSVSEEENTKRSQVINNLIKDLEAKDEKKVIGALKRIPHEGSSDMIKPMLRLVKTGPSDEVRVLLEKVLFSLKDNDCIPPLLESLNDPEFEDVNFIILASFWQSGLDVSDNLSIVVKAACDGDYMTAVEAMSVIENCESINDRQLAASIKHLDEALDKKKDSHALLEDIRKSLVDQLIT